MTTTTLTQDNIWEAMDDFYLYYPVNFEDGEQFIYRFANNTINSQAAAIRFLKIAHMAISLAKSQAEVDDVLKINGQPQTDGCIARKNWVMPNYPINKELFA